MARRKEYIRVRVSNLEEYIAHMMAHPRVGYYHDAWIELSQQIGANLDMNKIIAESIEIKQFMDKWNSERQ